MTIENTPQAQAAAQQRIQKEVAQLLQGVGLPPLSAQGLQLSGSGAGCPSSFRVDVAGAAALASATVATAQLAALRRPGSPPPQAQIDIGHVLAETTGYFTVDGQRPDIWAPLSGLYACGGDVGQPGWVRIHANFAHHRDGVLRLLGLPQDGSVTKQAVANALQALTAIEFEAKAAAAGLVAAAVRTPTEWAAHPQSAAVAAQPLVSITQLDSAAPAKPRAWAPLPADAAPLAGLKVLDLTRILAGPVAARCLAAQGAQVLMVNGPGLPNIEAIADVSRGKRSALLDVASDAGAAQLRHLLADAHVLLQGYRPGALQALGFGPQAVAQLRPGIVYASLSAYGRGGPWADWRGFDSLVQTACGINVAEAAAFGDAAPRALPMQILDYGAGFLLALGMQAALYRQATEGGTWHVEVSLARVAQWLQALGQRPVDGFDTAAKSSATGQPETLAPYLQTLASGFGALTAVRPSGQLAGVPARWPHPSVPPGTDQPFWDSL